ncbi:hypothetical protein [Variovorax sp. N23]|uniref:hypothetical protein n=1 Tax=Variovorax sp. N23 TaxID=2980555 RepID=UPI0021C7D971|nr:hypothetical protein [Variovorax sp. N23]MCU4118196.1 hypothetical protein [Variovorax sp. N23]
MPSDIVKRVISQCADDAAPPADVARAIVGALKSLHAELTMVVGVQAASSLIAHAVHRTRTTVGWTLVSSAVITDKTLDALRDDLAARPPAGCRAAGEFLLLTLVDHLISLIGQPLTRRMLHSAWNLPDAAPTSHESLQ